VATLALGRTVQERWEDPIEWSFALLLCLQVLVTARLWRETDYRLMLDSRR
jgi:hypothetical protein